MVKSLHTKHWLVHVLRRAAISGAEELALDPGTPAPEAWSTVCDTLGLTLAELARYVADYFRLKVAVLERAESTAMKLVPEKVARQYSIYPLREDDRHLTVATSDPTNFAAEQALGFISGRKAIFEVAPPPYILDAINTGYSPDGAVEKLLSRVDEEISSSVAVVQQEEAIAVTEAEAEAAPVVKLTNLILRDAVMNGASDIHIEPGPSGGTVRFRIDGVLRNYMQLPLPALVRVVSRIKIMGSLDIANRWRPQDGRTRVVVEGRPYDIRISTVPTRGAEKVVLRVLKGGQAARLNEIGLPSWELSRLRQLLANRDGIVCVTGPTGSGKTTTLYAAIRELATGEVNIMTVEDPVEYELPGITQIQVQPKRGVTFASALRAILRQDPDVILVGEIRDLETAEVAVQAAMTGHLVLATLHTNDAVSAVARLLDIGLDRPSIAATLRGTLAQRLVRKVCDECGEPIRGEMTDDEARLARLYNLRPPIRSVGCRRCAETGYRGRLPVQEVFVVNTAIADMITNGATQSELWNAAISSGMRSLLQVGLERVRNGETTLDELERVLGLEAEDGVTDAVPPPRDAAAGERLAGSGAVGAPGATGGDRPAPEDRLAGPERPERPEQREPGLRQSQEPEEPRERVEAEAAEAAEAAMPAEAGADLGEAMGPEEDLDALIAAAARLDEVVPQAPLDPPAVDLSAVGLSRPGPEGGDPGRTERGERTEPVERAGPSERAEPVDAAEPMERAEPMAGVEPIERAEPGERAERPAGYAPTGPSEPTQASEPTGPLVGEPEPREATPPPAAPGEAGSGVETPGPGPGHPGGERMGLGGPEGGVPILVVDDDPEDRLLVRTLLQKHGFPVDEAQSGEEALERIGRGRSHALVVLDLEMPELDGRQVLARLRDAGLISVLPVVVMTGSPDPEDEYRVMEAGADDYLRKPLDPPRFIARIKATLRRARMA